MTKARDDDLPQHHLGQGHYGELSLNEFPDASGFPSGTTVLWDGASTWYLGAGGGVGSDAFFEAGPSDNPKLLAGLNTIYSEDASSYVFLGGGSYAEISDGLNEVIFMDANGKINMASDFGVVLPMRAVDPSGGDSEVGQVYYHSGSHTIRRYDGAAWDDVGGTGSDDKKVKVSSNDTTPDYLLSKLVAGTGITIVENNNGSNETITIHSTVSGTAGTFTVLKTSDETVNNSAVLQNDDELKFAIGANEKWHFECDVYYTSGGAVDLKATWVSPSGSTLIYSQQGQDAANAVRPGTNADGSGVTVTLAGVTGLMLHHRFIGVISNGATPGDLQFQWAQNTQTASDSTVHALSSLKLIEL